MKNRIRKTIALTLVLSFAIMYSCDDSFLEVPVTGQLNQTVLSGRLGIESALIAAYAQVNGRGNRMASPSNWVWGSIRGGDANKGTDPGDFSDINPIQRFEALPTQGVISDRYNGSYEGVARCNAVMKLLSSAGPDVSDALKISYEAQTRFLRAHYYFELKRHFNDTPYVDESVDVGTGIEAVKNDVDLWPKIEADMEFAFQNLPVTQGQVGRVNKWAAAAYLAKIYMYQNKFAQAKTLYDQMINPDGTGKVVTSNNKTWGLVPYYANVFKASNDNHEESVWAYQAAANTGSVNNANPEFDLNWPYNTGPDGPGNCCGFFQPSFELGNSFRTGADGLPLLDGSYNVGANQLKTDMGLESADPFIPDAGTLDPRIDHSIGRRGIMYLDWIKFPGKSWIRNQPNGGPYAPKKYVYYKSDKGSLQDNSSWTPGYTAINYTIIRYADVLLMAAEAEIEVGDPNRAKVYVNAVRARAANSVLLDGGVPAANYVISQYPAGDVWAKNDATRNKVRFERKLELSGEGHRFYDLHRWGIATATINAYLTYEAPKLPSGALVGSTFTPNQDEYLPIPQGQIDLVGASILKQNPGY
ncbi:MAG: RagB/SusD family nutrient uptake outer membrane protein [Cyclobacteriaceae bacterium]|nr:RagB/SusD family nutrient uptake outer membrane protein [Cyclobacteriaceae bacterium]